MFPGMMGGQTMPSMPMQGMQPGMQAPSMPPSMLRAMALRGGMGGQPRPPMMPPTPITQTSPAQGY